MSDATRVAIIGLGAIGGSAALRLLERGVTPKGFTLVAGDRPAIKQAGVTLADTIESAVADVDLVLLAVPLDALADVARQVVRAAPATATIFHAASLQRATAIGLDAADRERVIGTHPLAGTARAGFAAAAATMFNGATVYVEPRGSRRGREDAELFWSMAGATKIQYLDANEHDDRMAAVSHLPQLLATALAATLAGDKVDPETMGPAGRDMTRLAASPWSMWAPLLAASPDRTSDLLANLATELARVRSALEDGGVAQLESTWSRARAWREALDR